MSKDIQIKRLKNYLLGKLSKSEAEKIDLEVISNEGLEESLIIAEEFLIEDYLENELSKKDKSLFQNNFLISEDREQQVKTIAQLKNYSGNLDIDAYSDEDVIDDEPNLFEKFINSFKILPVRAFASLVVVGLVGSIAWSIYSNNSNGRTQLELEYAELNNQENFGNLSDLKKYKTLTLLSGKTRSVGKSNSLEKDVLTERVLINLAIKSDSKKKETFKVELINYDGVRFTLERVSPVTNEFGKELRFFLPKSLLEKGAYQISVTSNSNENNSVSYPFEIR